MIKNKKELVEYIKKVKHPRIEPCMTVEKGEVAWYYGVATISSPAIMCHYDDREEVKSILREVKEDMNDVS